MNERILVEELLRHMQCAQSPTHLVMPHPLGGGLSDDARLSFDVCLTRTSGLSREQRGLRRLKLA